tara:strand:- start:113 stop:301 length:189 start_codon:yes stop_codon:yes gene_type:complete
MSVEALFIPFAPILWGSKPTISIERCAMRRDDGGCLGKIGIVLGYTGAVGCIVVWVSAIRAG